jgi:hypothetical protein
LTAQGRSHHKRGLEWRGRGSIIDGKEMIVRTPMLPMGLRPLFWGMAGKKGGEGPGKDTEVRRGGGLIMPFRGAERVKARWSWALANGPQLRSRPAYATEEPFPRNTTTGDVIAGRALYRRAGVSLGISWVWTSRCQPWPRGGG